MHSATFLEENANQISLALSCVLMRKMRYKKMRKQIATRLLCLFLKNCFRPLRNNIKCWVSAVETVAHGPPKCRRWCLGLPGSRDLHHRCSRSSSGKFTSRTFPGSNSQPLRQIDVGTVNILFDHHTCLPFAEMCTTSTNMCKVRLESEISGTWASKIRNCLFCSVPTTCPDTQWDHL